MTIYQISIQKSVESRFWTNRYWVNADTISNAQDAGDDIVAAEKLIHAAYVDFISMRTSLATEENPSVYLVKPLSGEGGRTVTTVVPLTVCLRVLLQKGPGRPDVKYYRGCVQASDIADVATFASTFISGLNSGFCEALKDVVGLTTQAGTAYANIQASPRIAQHQLTRGTRKATQPVIPVS
jgi:hypothetical protein